MGTRMAAKKGRKRNQRENIRKIEKNCLFHKHKHCLSRQSHRTYKTNFFWKQQKSLAKLQNIMSTPENQPHFYIVGVNYQKPKKIKFFKICSFLAVLGLHCCVQDFSSWGEWGGYSLAGAAQAFLCRGFSCRPQALSTCTQYS